MLDTIVWLVLAYFVLRVIANSILESNSFNETRQELLEQADRMIREVKLEILNEHNTVLAYDKENNDFLGQAASIDALKETLKERFPRKIFLLNKEVVTALPIKEKL